MIQFNLLPDVKIKYIKTRRQKRLIILVSSVIGVSALAVTLVIGIYVLVIQGAQLSSLDKQIKASTESIQTKRSQVDDINKVLTVQNQLNSLDPLHESKPIMSRMFSYLSRLRPEQVTVSSVEVAYAEGANTITIIGNTPTLEAVNVFADTLKFTKYKSPDGSADSVPVFTEVVLTSFSRDKEGASYSMTMKYNPDILSTKGDPSGFIVPNQVTTRSEVNRPILQTQAEQDINEQNSATEETAQ